MTALAAVCGAGFGVGVTLVAAGLRGVPFPALGGLRAGLAGPAGARRLARTALAVGVGLLVVVVTGWPVAGVLVALAVACAPGLLGGQPAHQRLVQRTEAIAGWAEMLRDTLAGAAGIEQAITATAPVAPTPIRAAVRALAARLEHQPPAVALGQFADELADPTGDLVVAALLHATGQQAGRVGEQLGALAAAARQDATMRLRVEASRARVQTSVRVITATTLGMAAGLALFGGGFLAPYATPVGQLVLAVVGGLFALGLRWLSALSRPVTPRRILTPAREAPR